MKFWSLFKRALTAPKSMLYQESKETMTPTAFGFNIVKPGETLVIALPANMTKAQSMSFIEWVKSVRDGALPKGAKILIIGSECGGCVLPAEKSPAQ